MRGRGLFAPPSLKSTLKDKSVSTILTPIVGFSLAGVCPFAFPSPSSSTWLQFSSPRFYFIFCTPMFRLRRLAVLLGFRPLLHTFYLSCQCASPGKHRVSVVLSFWLRSPSHTLYLIFECAWPRKHWVCVALLSSAPLSLALVFICYVSVLRLANTGFITILFRCLPFVCVFFFLCVLSQVVSFSFPKVA